jgi:hypothetical protein
MKPVSVCVSIEIKAISSTLNQSWTSLKLMMQLTRTIFFNSTAFIEEKRANNLLWRKSAFGGEEVKNACKLMHLALRRQQLRHLQLHRTRKFVR